MAHDLRPLSNIEMILIHRNTAGGTAEAVRDFHTYDPDYRMRLFPYHFFIDYVAEDMAGEYGMGDVVVQQVHSLDVICPHSSGENRKAVGIALNIDGRKYPPSGQMLTAVSELCARLHAAFPRAAVRGHSRMKKCPGQFVPVQWIAARTGMLAQHYRGSGLGCIRSKYDGLDT